MGMVTWTCQDCGSRIMGSDEAIVGAAIDEHLCGRRLPASGFWQDMSHHGLTGPGRTR